jgi:cytochrome c oxidase subunit II
MLHGFLAATLLAAATASAAPDAAVDVVASNWAFSPATITLHAGTPTTVRFTSKEGVHGVASDALGIPATTLLPGKTTTLVVTPKKAGTYTIPCSVVCGAGHENMKLTVNVEQ